MEDRCVGYLLKERWVLSWRNHEGRLFLEGFAKGCWWGWFIFKGMMGGWNDGDVARWISWDESSRYFKSLIHESEVEEAVTVTVPSLEPWDAVEGVTHWCIEIPYGHYLYRTCPKDTSSAKESMGKPCIHMASSSAIHKPQLQFNGTLFRKTILLCEISLYLLSYIIPEQLIKTFQQRRTTLDSTRLYQRNHSKSYQQLQASSGTMWSSQSQNATPKKQAFIGTDCQVVNGESKGPISARSKSHQGNSRPDYKALKKPPGK